MVKPVTDDIFTDAEAALPDVGLLDVGHPAGEDRCRRFRSRRDLQRDVWCAGHAHFPLSSASDRCFAGSLVAANDRVRFVDAHRSIRRRCQR